MAGERQLSAAAELHVVLVAPQIAPNTGNIVRLCANVGAQLHLVEPLGFSLEDRLLRRAGLDYHDLTAVHRHADWAASCSALAGLPMVAFSSRGARSYVDVQYARSHVLVFGAEQNGLPADVLATFPPGDVVRLPMRPGNRSLNLANACAVALYEAWRQQGFTGAG